MANKTIGVHTRKLTVGKTIMTICRLVFLVILGLVRTPDVFSQELFPGEEPIRFSFLDKVQKNPTIGGYPVLELGGELGLVHLKTTYSTGSSIPLGNAYMVDVRDGKFFAAIEMQGNLDSAHSSGWTDEPCKRTDFLWKRSVGGAYRDVNCALINHHTKYFSSPSGDFQQYLVEFRAREIEIPPTILRAEFVRYHDNGRRLVYKVTVNPEAFGFARDAEPLWGANSWHKSQIAKDPKKVAFVDRLSKWAEQVQNRVDSAFNKNRDAFSNLPEFLSYLKPGL